MSVPPASARDSDSLATRKIESEYGPSSWYGGSATAAARGLRLCLRFRLCHGVHVSPWPKSIQSPTWFIPEDHPWGSVTFEMALTTGLAGAFETESERWIQRQPLAMSDHDQVELVTPPSICGSTTQLHAVADSTLITMLCRARSIIPIRLNGHTSIPVELAMHYLA